MENNKLLVGMIDELTKLRKKHKESWDIYGSELCAGEMLKKEELLEKKINEIKKREKK